MAVELSDQPFDAESLGDSEDADLVLVQSGEDWVAQLDDDMSRPASQAGELFRMTALQLEDTTCATLLGVNPDGCFYPVGGGQVIMSGTAVFVAPQE